MLSVMLRSLKITKGIVAKGRILTAYCTNNAKNEEEKSKDAKHELGPTIFDKIIKREIKANVIHEDDECLAFEDVNPQAPVHFLVIPKRRIPMLSDSNSGDVEILGKLLQIAGTLGQKHAPSGFRVVVNNGVHGCQSVYHLHIHVIGGRQMKWPPG